MKKHLFALASGAAVLALTPAAHAHHAGPQHWGGSGDRNVSIVNSVTGSWDAAFEGARADWSASADIDLVASNGSSSKRSRSKCRAAQGTIRVCNYNYGRTGIWRGTAGLANTVYTTGTFHIVKSKVRLNASYVKSDHDKRVVSCHEIGHALGLNHRLQFEASCLTPILGAFQGPDVTDISHLEAAHDDHAASIRSATTGEDVVVVERGPYTVVMRRLMAR